MKLHNPLPESLSAQCNKAASILEHFVKGTTKLDATFIPTKVLDKARGIAIITIVKAGCLWSGRAGSGLVVARLPDGSWSAPSAIMAAGAGIGAQFGAEITDYIFVLNNAAAVRAFSHGGNFTLGANMSVAAGPTGRATEAAGAFVNMAPIYSYSKSKGLFAGISLEGTVIITRADANKAMYGRKVKASELMTGVIPPPVEAEPLYRMLNTSRFVNVGQKSLGPRAEYLADGADQLPAGAVGGSGTVARKTSAKGGVAGNSTVGMRSNTVGSYSSSNSSSGGGVSGSYLGTAGASASAIHGSEATLNEEPLLTAAEKAAKVDAIKAKLSATSSLKRTAGTSAASTTTPPPAYNAISPVAAASGQMPAKPPKPSTLADPASAQARQAVALFDYTGQRPGDLSFRQGDTIWVTRATGSQDDWWTGRVGTTVGEFPANYVSV
ncbi:hypothetical protein BC831DRAFT_444680 [Entophlyctis helioformis]|nr:hypothetical protein BC831DRAFT_444680 [Entophlyctis helioformis]